MNRKEKLVTGEYYHVYNRGVEKRRIFLGQKDYQRFEDLLFHYLLTDEKYSDAKATADSLAKQTSQKVQSAPEAASGETSADEQRQINHQRGRLGFLAPVALIAYVLMPNHFHLLLKQLIDRGTTNYLHRVTTSLTNYFNKKNERVGPLLQGRFKYKRIESEEQLLYGSKYIHRNPVELGQTKTATADNLLNYRWSSLPDYLSGSNGFLLKDPVLGTFASPGKYRQFVFEDYDEKQTASLDVLRLD